MQAAGHPEAGLSAGVICGNDKNCIVETKAARLSLKGELSPSGQIACSRSGEVFAAAEKKERVQMAFSGVHIY